MLELIRAGGWLMWPIIACSIVALAIVFERIWSLRRRRIIPPQLVAHIRQLHQSNQLDDKHIAAIRDGSPLGRILAAALVNRQHSHDVMKEAITDTGRHVVAKLERFLNTLGTIAAITPLLGLLGTVFGMIDIFSVIQRAGNGNVGLLAGGISVALLTTAAGLCVAIPALMFHRYFDGRVEQFAIEMEAQALQLVEIIKGEREPEDEAQ
ncbi:biopolymer transporter ExbB [Chromatium weissei]|nr:biopolymer transporter ExbB [Chromatium weissei]